MSATTEGEGRRCAVSRFIAGDWTKPARSLTGRYGVLQGSYWAIYSGVFSFAAAFLLAKGFGADRIGVVLALATLASCLLQPPLAALADHSRRVTLRALVLLLALVSWLALAALLFVPLAPGAYLLLFLLGALLLDMMQPLLNALSVYYNERGVPLNYGVGRGVGSLAFAAASFTLGHAMERFGASFVLGFSVCLYALYILVALSLPRHAAAAPRDGAAAAPRGDCTVPQFFGRYKWYCVSLLGLLFMAAFHAMTENYLISIMGAVGGGSGDLGTALAIATVLETPVVMFFSRFRHRARTETWLKLASLAFLLKSFVLLLAPNVLCVTLAQLLQPVSYGFYAACAVYYAREQVAAADMVKGQAMLTAFYALGCSLGSFLGGRILERAGVRELLLCGIALAAAAAVIMCLSAGRGKEGTPYEPDKAHL